MALGTEIALIKALGGGASLPSVTSADAGKVLGVNDSGVWGAQEPIGKKFIVTLTPTALDYSGTMDKTVAEINAAYEAGQEIWANISAQGKNLYIPLEMASTNGEDQYPSFDFCTYDIEEGLLILAFTAYTNDGTKQTYSTAIYTLTPAT